jgi:hypothetical protein
MERGNRMIQLCLPQFCNFGKDRIMNYRIPLIAVSLATAFRRALAAEYGNAISPTAVAELVVEPQTMRSCQSVKKYEHRCASLSNKGEVPWISNIALPAPCLT